MKRNKLILAVLVLSMIALIFSGCGGGGNPIIPPIPEEEPIEIIVPETTKVVEEETIEEIVFITEDQSTIVFKKSTPQLEEFVSGDIIAMGVTKNTPEGLLRKVKNITKGAKDSSEVIIETEFASLEEAIEQGEFYFNEALKAEDAKEPVCYVKGIEFIRDKSTIKKSEIQLLEFIYNINTIIYDEDNNPNTKEDNIALTGQISFDYNLLLSGKITFFQLKELNFQNIVEVEKNLGIIVGGSVKIFSYEKILFTQDLGIKIISIGCCFPVILHPKITIIANVDGEIFAELTAEVTDTDIYTAGIQFDNGSWQPISSHEDSYTPPSLSLSTGGAITFGVGPKLECKVDGVVGPYCETSLYGKVIADIYENPWWKIYVGIIAKAGVKIEIFSKVFASAELTILDLQKIIKQADGPFGGTNHAPVISSLTATPSSIDINQTTNITCAASDEDVGDTLTYTWTKTDGTFEGSISGSTIIWKAPSTKGNYTVSCEVSDGEASDSEQVVITINAGSTNHPPNIISSPVTSATKGQPYSYDVNATDSDGDIPVYSLTNKPSGMTINSSTGLIIWTPTVPGSFGVTVKASDGELFDTQSFTVTVEETSTTLGQVQLSSPSNGTAVNTSTVTLSWGFVPDATGYEVVYDTSSNFTNPIGWSVSGTSKTTGTLTDGTTYYWRVRAFAGSQYSSWSSVWSFTKSGTIVPQDVTLNLYICENSTSGPPLSGVGIGIVDGGGNSLSQITNSSGYVTITGTPGTWYFSASKSGYDTNSWSQSITTNCTKYGYIVKSATPIGTIVVSATLDGSYWFGSLSYSLTGPSSSSGSTVSDVLSNKPVGSYSIAFNSGGPSNASLSSIIPSSTQTLSEGGVIAFTLNFIGSTLLPPTGFSVSSYWNTVTGFPSMNLSWNAVSGATGYEMWVRPSGGSYAYLGTRDAPYVTFNSNSLPGGARYVSGTTYYFKLRTVTASGTSDFTSEVSCVAAAPSIGQVQLSSPGNGVTLPPMSVTFIWNPISNATKYQFILYNQQGQVALDSTYSSTFTIIALGTEETITWKVRAGDNSGNWGAWSSTSSLTIKSLT